MGENKPIKPLPNPPLVRGGKKIHDTFVQYDKNLVLRARELRKNQTEAEKIAWENIFKDKKVTGHKFSRQKPIDYFIVDFYCADLLLAVEIDGEIHKFSKLRDIERDNALEKRAFLEIIRYPNKQICESVEFVKNDLLDKIRLRRKYLEGNSEIPAF